MDRQHEEIFRRLDVLSGQVIRLGTRFEDVCGGPQPIDSLAKGNLLGRILKLEEHAERPSAPPKDLSDPYPLDGPNVREQRWREHVIGRINESASPVRALEARLTALSETVARHKRESVSVVHGERRVSQRRTKAFEPPRNQLRRVGLADRRRS